MKTRLATITLWLSWALMGFSVAVLVFRWEPFLTYFYVYVWWAMIGIMDSRLYLQRGESLFWSKTGEFVTFLVPFSAFLWFGFELFNLRLGNWSYHNVPASTPLRWAGNFAAFGTVVPGIFLIAETLDHAGIFQRNEFSRFFSGEIPKPLFWTCVVAGVAMLAAPLAFPGIFYPLVWGGWVLLLDPINARWGGDSLIQEWRQKNFNRTAQLLLAGLIAGFLWESWNYWAGARWAYHVPLPVWLGRDLKLFEMPLLGFLGFPPFALECFVMTQFARNLSERTPEKVRPILWVGMLVFGLWLCRLMDLYTVRSFR